MSVSKSFEFTAAVRGFHVYRSIWSPQLTESLNYYHEEGNSFDIFAIKACRLRDNEIVGHLPREIARRTKYLLDRGAVVTSTLISDHYRRSPLFQGGLEIPCVIKITIAGTVKGHMLIDRYAEMVEKLYCDPEEELIIGSFLESTTNACFQPKKRKIPQKTVAPSKSKDIRSMFQKITHLNNENESIEINSD